MEEKISQWVDNTAGVLAGHLCTNEELLAAFNGLSDEDAGRLCDYFLSVEIGTITDKYEIIPQLSSNLSLNLSSNGYRSDRIGLNLLFVAICCSK